MPPLVASLQELEGRRQVLEARLPATQPDVVVPHPQAASRYRGIIERLEHELRAEDATATRAIEIVRSLIRNVCVIPTPGRKPVRLELQGDLAAMIALAEGQNDSASPRPLALIELAI